MVLGRVKETVGSIRVASWALSLQSSSRSFRPALVHAWHGFTGTKMFGTIMRLGKPAIVVLVTSVLWILLCTVYV